MELFVALNTTCEVIVVVVVVVVVVAMCGHVQVKTVRRMEGFPTYMTRGGVPCSLCAHQLVSS